MLPGWGWSMAVIRVTDDATNLDLARAITALRAKQIAVELQATKAEIQTEIDGLLDRMRV